MMPRIDMHRADVEQIAQKRIFDPLAMSDEERASFGEILYGLCRSVFDGVTKEMFLDSAFNPKAFRTRIMLCEDRAGEAVGYVVVQCFQQIVDGRTVPVFRAEAGILPCYRGRNATLLFGLREAALYKLRHLFQQVFFMDTLVHPSSYHLLARHFPVIYPSRLAKTPPETLTFMVKLADSFGKPRIENDPLRRGVGWITRESPDSLPRSPEAMANKCFFAKMNPGYRKGHGLVTLVPLTFTNLLAGTWRLVLVRLAGS